MNQADHILEVLPAGCIIFDDHGQIQYANPAFCEILAVSPTELSGWNFTKVLSVPSQIFYQTHLFPLLKLEGKAKEIFLTLKSTDGSRIPVVMNVKREAGPDSNRNICVVITIWERQKYEQELVSTKSSLQTAANDNQDLQELAAQLQQQKQVLDRKVVELTKRKQEYAQLSKVLMHDLQEPMRKIGFFFDRVLSDQNGTASGQDLVSLNKIKGLIARLRNLTDSIQRFVYYESANDGISALSIKELIDYAKSEVNIKMGKTDFEILIESEVEFQGRNTDMQSLFYELVSNAVRFRRPDVPLAIKVRCSVIEENSFQGTLNEYWYTDHLQIEFSDNGIGFDPEHGSYIFGLFNKLGKNSEGVGLGLSLCHQIVSRHYGKITAQSQTGKGATFFILLPLVQPDNDPMGLYQM